jgi:hypothetical protein
VPGKTRKFDWNRNSVRYDHHSDTALLHRYTVHVHCRDRCKTQRTYSLCKILRERPAQFLAKKSQASFTSIIKCGNYKKKLYLSLSCESLRRVAQEFYCSPWPGDNNLHPTWSSLKKKLLSHLRKCHSPKVSQLWFDRSFKLEWKLQLLNYRAEHSITVHKIWWQLFWNISATYRLLQVQWCAN